MKKDHPSKTSRNNITFQPTTMKNENLSSDVGVNAKVITVRYLVREVQSRRNERETQEEGFEGSRCGDSSRGCKNAKTKQKLKNIFFKVFPSTFGEPSLRRRRRLSHHSHGLWRWHRVGKSFKGSHGAKVVFVLLLRRVIGGMKKKREKMHHPY